LTLFHSAYA